MSRRRRLLMILIGADLAAVLALRLLGYQFGRNTTVRCREGHLFTTTWIPGASLKAIRLGWWRLQRCPVGAHWTLVHPVKEGELSDEERAAAGRRDTRVP